MKYECPQLSLLIITLRHSEERLKILETNGKLEYVSCSIIPC